MSDSNKQKTPIPWLIAGAAVLLMFYLSYQWDRSLHMQYQLDLLIREQDSIIEAQELKIQELELLKRGSDSTTSN